MKISNSKKELARIISENGGWRDESEFAAQDGDGTGSIDFFKSTPRYDKDDKYWKGEYDVCERISQSGFTIKNFHQTILSRAEYFHLYPAQDADGWIEWNGGSIDIDDLQLVDYKMRCTPQGSHLTTASMNLVWDKTGEPFVIIAYRLHKPGQAVPEFCESVMRSIPEPEAKPTIEQLAADYRNAKDYAERKQKEADDAKADADEKLRVLEIAGEALGLLVSPINAKKDPEMVISVQVGDEAECIKSNVNPNKYRGMIGTVLEVDYSSTPYLVDFGGKERIWCHEVKFIRRP